jgi:hypothetical protein
MQACFHIAGVTCPNCAPSNYSDKSTVTFIPVEDYSAQSTRLYTQAELDAALEKVRAQLDIAIQALNFYLPGRAAEKALTQINSMN